MSASPSSEAPAPSADSSSTALLEILAAPRRRDLRLVPTALIGWVTAVLLIGWPSASGSSATVLWSGVVCALGIALVARPTGRRAVLLRQVAATTALCLAVGALSATAIWAHYPQRSPEALHRAVEHNEAVELAATVTGQPGYDSEHYGAQQVSAPITITKVTAIDGSETAVRARSMIFARIDEPVPDLAVGATITATARLKQHSEGSAIAFLAMANDGLEVVAAPSWWNGWANTLRADFADAALRLPGDGGDLLPGLAIGDTTHVSDGLDAAMKASSLSHLTAVSGSNCAVIVVGVMALLAACGARRRTRAIGAVISLVAFVVLVIPDASVLRATVMALVVVVCLAAGRPASGLPALCVAVLGLVVADPWMARDYAFLLSVLATAGLLLLAPPMARALSRWLGMRLATVVAIPLAAQVACQPVLVLLQPVLPTYGVVANLLAEPAAPVATVLGLLACLVLPVVPGLGYALAQLAWLPSAWIAWLAETTSRWPGASLPWLGSAAGFVAAALLALALSVAIIAGGGALRRSRIVAVVVLLATAGGYVGAFAGGGLARSAAVPRDWLVAACDIGQGDAVAVNGGGGHYALVDTGPDPAALAECLDQLGIDDLDLLVLSHYDLDHIGGTEAVVGRVGTVLVGPADRDAARLLNSSLREGGAKVREVTAGDEGVLGEASWRVLWPSTNAQADDGNEMSVTLETRRRGVTTLFLGDLDERVQDRLYGRVEPVDIVKVAHHGSADQSRRFYRRLHARLGLISVGEGNSFGHPTDRALDILAAAGTAVERTDRSGLIVVGQSDGALSVWSEREPEIDQTAEPSVVQ